MVDCRISNSYPGQLLPHDMGGVSYRCARRDCRNPNQSLKRRLGQLFLGVFSGPVEGILMVCCLFVMTGFTGMQNLLGKKS